MLLPLRHPTLVAKEFSCLDVLSGGRAILTVGVGGDYPREFAGCGIPIGERGRRATEAIEIIRKFWTGERFDYDGRIFKLTDADMLPTPVQPGGVPIWVSGRQDAPMRRAATLGDGWHPYMYTAKRSRESFLRIKEMADFVDAGANYLILAPIMPPGERRGHLERLSTILTTLQAAEPGKVL